MIPWVYVLMCIYIALMHNYLTGHLPDCKTAVSSVCIDTWPGGNLKSKI